MARPDAIGFFWQDVAKVKPPKAEKVKRTPPHPFWLDPNYLPGLAEAQRFDVPLFTDWELVAAAANRERLVWDIECYPNYFLIAFKSIVSGKIVYFEDDGDLCLLDLQKLQWVLENFCIISFNGLHYDQPIATIALSGASTYDLHWATEEIIVRDERPHNVLKKFKVKKLKELNHIDLKEVAPLHDSLKTYAGRLHTKRMQDLPFPPGTVLSAEQMCIVRYYCVNDLRCTEELYNELLPAIKLRETMSAEYGTDLRSKSDAQIAEAVVLAGLRKATGQQFFPQPKVDPGHSFKYQIPGYIKYQTPLLNWVLDNVRAADFVIDDNGKVIKPPNMPLEFDLADGHYTMGVGGLHSFEQVVTHEAGDDWLLIDRDVASFYPRVIITQNLFPKHLGKAFINVYRGIVDRRLAAKDKAAELKAQYKGKEMPPLIAKQVKELTGIADSLKITINGLFGKFGNAFSMVYSPNLMIQVTLTGQLVLLMLIERLELAGIRVVSANTDGIVIKCHKTQKAKLDAIVKQWETDIDCQTEETYYRSIHNRDVNSYFAIKPDGEVKVKGTYAERGSAGNSVLSKNPSALVARDAVIQFLLKGTPVDHTVLACTDIRRFVSVRYVKGGAVKVYNKFGEAPTADANEYLGKVVRWYYSKTVTGEIVYAKSGNKVAETDRARPLMTLPDELPQDIDHEWYIAEARKILEKIGRIPPTEKPKKESQK